MRSFIAFICVLSILACSGCGGGGGGGSSGSNGSGGGNLPPPNPYNGIATFGNGVQFDTNLDSSTNFQKCTYINRSSWQFPTVNAYTLNGYGNQVSKSITFKFYNSNLLVGGTVAVTRMDMDFFDGTTHTVEQRFLSMDLNGGIYLMGVSGTGSGDFMLNSLSASPQPFLAAGFSPGSTWQGGFSGTDLMHVLSVTDTAPGGETNCVHIQQTVGSQITDWWFLLGSGFVDTQRATNGYLRDANSTGFGGLSRTPFSNG